MTTVRITPERVITTYEQVKMTATKTVTCTVCSKKLRRQRTFTNTVNPFNRNADGTQKTRQEVLKNVRLMAIRWKMEPEKCKSHP